MGDQAPTLAANIPPWYSINNLPILEMGFASAAMKYFERKPGEGLQTFMAEIKAFTEADRAELTPLLERELNITIKKEG